MGLVLFISSLIHIIIFTKIYIDNSLTKHMFAQIYQLYIAMLLVIIYIYIYIYNVVLIYI